MSSFDERNLDEKSVKLLIAALKHPTRRLDVARMKSTISNCLTLLGDDLSDDSVVLDEIDGIRYILHIYVGDPYLARLKYTISLRFKKTNLTLVRVDVGGRHKNPGEKSAKMYPHIHIYDPDHAKKDRVAYPLEVGKFPNIDGIMQTFDATLKYTNIQEKQ